MLIERNDEEWRVQLKLVEAYVTFLERREKEKRVQKGVKRMWRAHVSSSPDSKIELFRAKSM